VADGWCWFVLREEYCWLVGGGWFVLREKYCWLMADKPSEQADGRPHLPHREEQCQTPRAAVPDTRRSEEQANLPAVAHLRSRAPSASLTWPRWSRPEALLAVLELELGPAATDLRGPLAELERKLRGQANIRRFINLVIHTMF
jgi:hypothetical protein